MDRLVQQVQVALSVAAEEEGSASVLSAAASEVA